MTALYKTRDLSPDVHPQAPGYQDFSKTYTSFKTRITHEGNKPGATLAKRLRVFEDLCAFPLGRFLIQNSGLDAYWADYVIRGGDAPTQDLHPLEAFLLFKAPLMLALRERFHMSQSIIQSHLINGMCMVSAPCGLMRDLLTLDYSALNKLRLIGVDFDFEAIMHAHALADHKGLSTVTEYRQDDTTNLGMTNLCDVLISHNLQRGEAASANQEYQSFYKALKPGGLLITSFLTPGPHQDANSPWNKDLIPQGDLELATLIWEDIAKIHGGPYHTIDDLSGQLTAAGFTNIQCIYDSQRMLPTVIAQKPQA
jgi:SAM-dependent methyltransferase